ncbi:MAG: antitoxin Xre/MbcA/ParS toxin-binding domain-containing protein [Acidobacteriota bacterium]|nr:antitoxin Xre/MbcA/ParS toxin-binding domain-containing protein [Acidobacteriota bacterium]
MESVSLDSFPKPTTEEKKKFEEEQKKLYSNPEIRKKLNEDLEDYYLKEWIRTRIPALNNQTPMEAVKTEEGKRARLRDF